LEIRGAGDLLGGEQSGFINEIGFETYQKILAEAVAELKEDEFKDLYQEESVTQGPFVREVQIDTDFELLFPDDFVNSVSERLRLYTELNEISGPRELEAFRARVLDRFGQIPEKAADLLDSVRLKWIASDLGIEKLVLKKGSFIGYFIADQQSDFYQTERFGNILRYLQSNPGKGRLKEKQTRKGLRLLITASDIHSVQEALGIMKPLASGTEVPSL
jgi:transcription-repair coupling factor (superfamily II helicase)